MRTLAGKKFLFISVDRDEPVPLFVFGWASPTCRLPSRSSASIAVYKKARPTAKGKGFQHKKPFPPRAGETNARLFL